MFPESKIFVPDQNLRSFNLDLKAFLAHTHSSVTIMLSLQNKTL